MSLTHALKWSFLSELASKAVPPVVFIILARLLTPEDYGVMSSALMVISFSQIFWDAGMGKAIIQRQTDIGEAANVGFWINIGMGCIIATMLYFTATPIARIFFHDQRVTAVLQVMTIQVFFGAVSSVHTALLQKEMGFKKLFWVRFATVSLPGLASIPLALKGMGYWALVAGTLTGQMAQVIMLWIMSDWRPNFNFNTKLAGELLKFGAWVGGSGLLAWFYVWADSLIVGMYLGAHELGLYRTGNQFSSMIYAFVFGPITPVLYSHLSRMNQDKYRLGIAIQKVIKVLTLISIPIALIIYSLSEPISVALFGEKWKGIGFVIGVMGLMHGLSWVVGMNGEVYRAMGKPFYETIVTATTLVIYLTVYLLSIREGFNIFVWARFLLAFGALFLHLLVLSKVLSVNIIPVIKHLFLVTIVVIIIVNGAGLFLNSFVLGSWSKLVIGGVLNLGILGVIVYFVERNGVIRDVIEIIKNRK